MSLTEERIAKRLEDGIQELKAEIKRLTAVRAVLAGSPRKKAASAPKVTASAHKVTKPSVRTPRAPSATGRKLDSKVVARAVANALKTPASPTKARPGARREEAFRAIAAHPGRSTKEVAASIGVANEQAYGIVKSLAQAGRIEGDNKGWRPATPVTPPDNRPPDEDASSASIVRGLAKARK